MANNKAACLLEMAARSLRVGNVREAKKFLKAAEADLRRPLQVPPDWVVKDVLLELECEGESSTLTVLKVESVDSSRPWKIRCLVEGSSDHVYYLEQERGRRFWRKFRGKRGNR